MAEKLKISGINEEFDPKLFINIARKNLIWVFLFLGLSSMAAFFYLRYTPALFEASSIIKLGNENRASEILTGSVRVTQNPNQIAGEIELIRSKIIFENVIDKLPLSISYFAQGSVLVNELYKSSPFAVNVEILDSSIYRKPFYITFTHDLRSFKLNYTDFSGKEQANDYPVDKEAHTPFMNFTVSVTDPKSILSHQENTKKQSFYFTLNDKRELVNQYMKNMEVFLLNQDAQTIQIKFKDTNPRKTADLANAVSTEFIEYDINKKNETSDRVLEFINEQLDTVNRDLQVSESMLEHFKSSSLIAKPDAFTNTSLLQLNDLESKKVIAQLELSVITKLEQSITGTKEVSAVVPFLSGNDAEAIISAIVKTLNQLLEERDQLMLESTVEASQVKRINKRIDSQKKILIDCINNSKKSLIDRIASLQTSINSIEEDLRQLPSKEAEYSRLIRLFGINEKFYALLLEKRTEFQIKKAGFVTNNIVLQDAAIPQARISPNRTLIASSAIIFGFIAGFLLILIKYLMHNEVTSLEEVEKHTNASRLGIIPKYKYKIPVSMLLVDKNPKSIISEAFRSVRTNLQFISNNPGPKVIAVTSTISGEGKTFIAINLGGVIAFSGKKVIVLDLDMRKPKIHLGFNAENTRGMSTLLIGKDTMANCINHSILENLDFITAGPIPPNPSELIISTAMNELIDTLKKTYDIIIIDTPPVGIVTDGTPIIQAADYPIYILRANYSKKLFLRNINKLMEENNVKHLSVILNNAEMQHSKYGYTYGYGYGYNYGYGGYYGGYGYGYYDEDKPKAGEGSMISKIFSKK